LSLRKYQQATENIKKLRPDLLLLKRYIEGLPVETDDKNSLELAKYLSDVTKNPDIYSFLNER